MFLQLCDSGIFFSIVFFFNDTATTEIYTLSLHDALPISWAGRGHRAEVPAVERQAVVGEEGDDLHRIVHVARLDDAQPARDRKSTRLNSSHANISYAVFCLKKKNKTVISAFDFLSFYYSS